MKALLTVHARQMDRQHCGRAFRSGLRDGPPPSEHRRLTYECPAAREKLAYDAQEKWLGLFGRSLSQDFDVDPITLELTTACMH